MITTYYENGIEVNQTSEYLYTYCGNALSDQPDATGGGGADYHYAKNYTHTWLVAIVNDLGIYKDNTFTIEDNYFITGLGFGPISKSNTDPTNALVEEVWAHAEGNADYTEAHTACTAKITYPSDPDRPRTLPEGSRDWTVSQIKY